MQTLPQFVIRRLNGKAWAEPHPDADVLTAFAERSLAGGERSQVFEHLARCADCRTVIAMALPEIELGTAGSAPVLAPVRSRWLAWPAIRWGALAAGVLAVASVGVIHYHDGTRQGTVASNRAPSDFAESSSTPRAVVGENASSPAIVHAGASVKEKAGTHPEDLQSPQGRKGRTASTTSRKSAESIRTPDDAADEPEQIASNQIDMPIGGQSPESFDVVKAKDPVPLEATSPQWAVTANGGLRRSYDQGQTWENVNPVSRVESNAGQAVFLSVATNGSDVWAGGVAGVVFHSSDNGESWNSVAFSSDGMALSGDIASIQFSDPQHGTIATSTGELWMTADSGKSWRKQ